MILYTTRLVKWVWQWGHQEKKTKAACLSLCNFWHIAGMFCPYCSRSEHRDLFTCSVVRHLAVRTNTVTAWLAAEHTLQPWSWKCGSVLSALLPLLFMPHDHSNYIVLCFVHDVENVASTVKAQEGQVVVKAANYEIKYLFANWSKRLL